MIKFIAIGDPRPKARPRLGKYGNVFTPKQTVKAEQEFLKQALPHRPKKPFKGAIKLTFNFYKKGPKKIHGQYVIKRPDLDNYQKLVIDAMNEWFWLDDSQVADIHATKRYAKEAKTEVIIEEL